MNSCSILDPHSSIRFNGVCDRVAASIVRHWAPLVLTMFLPFLQAKKAEELAKKKVEESDSSSSDSSSESSEDEAPAKVKKTSSKVPNMKDPY